MEGSNSAQHLWELLSDPSKTGCPLLLLRLLQIGIHITSLRIYAVCSEPILASQKASCPAVPPKPVNLLCRRGSPSHIESLNRTSPQHAVLTKTYCSNRARSFAGNNTPSRGKVQLTSVGSRLARVALITLPTAEQVGAPVPYGITVHLATGRTLMTNCRLSAHHSRASEGSQPCRATPLIYSRACALSNGP